MVLQLIKTITLQPGGVKLFTLTVGCAKPWLVGNWICNEVNNNAACDFDGGDCCGVGVYSYIHWAGDGFCDDESNIEPCGYDGGDCCEENVNTWYCTECICYNTMSSTVSTSTSTEPTDTSGMIRQI